VPGAGCFDKPKGMLSMSIFGGKDPPSGASCSTDRRPNESIVETNILLGSTAFPGDDFTHGLL